MTSLIKNEPIKTIAIIGGGTAGWMTAALYSKLFPKGYEFHLVESEEIGSIGVGEATIPAINIYNRLLDLDEQEFMKSTNATFKLGIEFVNWRNSNHSYIHGFGKIGQDLEWLRTHQFWLKMREFSDIPSLDAYSINTLACRQNKFMKPRLDMPESPLGDIAYAYHFDANLYAAYLRKMSQARGVKRTEGKIVEVKLRPNDGFIDAVIMQNGDEIRADFFIDCSGMRALLIEGALKSGYEDWSEWLLCDRAFAVPCTNAKDLTPYTRSTAHRSGWQWRIPLQNRIGNGHVFSSRYSSEQDALDVLMNNLDGEVLADARLVKFSPGKRVKPWIKNCVAVGLASGFLEPLESTSIHLIQTAILRTIKFWPDMGFNQVEINEYNRQTDFEYERIRDFIIAHYKVTEREDSPFWDYCKHMSIPETLQNKLDVFAQHGRFFKYHEELFVDESWLQVLIGQGLMPQSYDPGVDNHSESDIRAYLKNIENVMSKCVGVMPSHADFIAHYCAADL